MSAPGYQVPRDPTAVVGLRTLAWIVDYALVLGLWLLLSPLGFLGEYVPGADDVDDACSQLEDSDDDVYSCVVIGDRAYVADGSDVVIQLGVVLIYSVVVLVIWQGTSGLTVGKALAGLRTVDENGQSPGIGRAFIRTILWIVDAQPCGIPAVGFITGLTSTGHRRVGDMAAKTYVIRKADAGRPVVIPGATPAYGAARGYAPVPGYGAPAGYGQPQPGYGQQQPAGYPAAPPTAGQWGAPPTAPTPPVGDWGATPGGPPQGGAPSGWPATSAPTPTPAPTPAPTQEGAPPTFGAGARSHEADSTGASGTVESPSAPAPAEPTGQAPSGERPAASGTPGAPIGGQAAAGGPATDQPTPEASPASEAPGTEDARAAGAGRREGDSPESAGPESPSDDTRPVAEGAGSGAAPTLPDQPRDDAAAGAGATGPGPAGETAAGAAEQAATQAQTYNPQWDAARGTYIQWDAARGHWLQWDDAAKQWRPI